MLFLAKTNGLEESKILAKVDEKASPGKVLTYKLEQIKGMEMEAVTWDTSEDPRQSTVDDGEKFFKETLKSFKGELLPYVELEVKNTKDNPVSPQTEEGEPAIVLKIKKVKSNDLIAIFYSDTLNDSDWIFPEEGTIVNGNTVEYTFHIPRITEEDMAEKGKTAISGPLKQLVRVILFGRKIPKNFDPELKGTTDEKMNKKYGLYLAKQEAASGEWGFIPFAKRKESFFEEIKDDWNASTGKPALLMIHGTNGNAKIGFGKLLEDEGAMTRLQEKYGNRIFAFNHPSLFRGVNHNANTLLKMLTDHIELFLSDGASRIEIDIITRSRGSLVSRQLVEGKTLPPEIQIGKVLMLAGPNQGSHSASKGNLIRTIRINRKLKQLDKLLNLHDNVSDLEEEMASLWAELMDREEKMEGEKSSEHNHVRITTTQLMYKKMDDDVQRDWFKYFLSKAANPVEKRTSLLNTYYGNKLRKHIRKTAMKLPDNQLESGELPLDRLSEAHLELLVDKMLRKKMKEKERVAEMTSILQELSEPELVAGMRKVFDFMTGGKPLNSAPEEIEDETKVVEEGSGFFGLLFHGALDQAIGSRLLKNLAERIGADNSQQRKPVYFAISREFNPMELDPNLEGLDFPGTSRLRRSLSRLLHKTFHHPGIGEIKSDGINPVQGAIGKLSAEHFPLVPVTNIRTEPLLIGKSKGIHHLNYLAHQEIRDELVEVLTVEVLVT